MNLIKEYVEPVEKRTKVPLWLFLALVIVLATVIMFSLGNRIQETVSRQTLGALSRVCEQNAKGVEMEISGSLSGMQALATRIAARFGQEELKTMTASLDEAVDVFGMYRMGLFDRYGMGYSTLGESFNWVYQDFYQKAMQGQSVVTESRYSNSAKMNLNYFAVPIWQEGKVAGVLTASYDSGHFVELLNADFLSGAGNSVIINGDGRIVTFPYGTMGTAAHTVVQHLMFAPGTLQDMVPETFIRFSFDNVEYIGYASPIRYNDWYVLSYLPYSFIEKEVGGLQSSIMFALGMLYLCILMAALLGLFTYRRLSNRIVEAAFVDDLTMTRNYEYLKLYFRSMDRADRAGHYLVVLDIDKFKFVNLLYGSEQGDEMLRYVVRAFQQALPDDQIFRCNADTFAAVLSGKNNEEIRDKIRKLDDGLKSRADKGNTIPLTVSYGICRMDADDSPRVVYDNALLAEKEAKGQLGKKYKFFDRIEEKHIRQREMEASFDAALHAGEFKVWYQPKYDMRTCSVCGAEALVRWQRGDGILVSPGEFIPLLEENGHIVELDEEVLRIVCRDLKAMMDEGIPLRTVSVNLSRVHLQKLGVVDRLDAIVRESGVDKQYITFEITESAIMRDRELLNALVSELHRRGYLVDMDDYGTGSSTLTSLSHTSFDTLKLDKSFIDNIGTEKFDIILRSTIVMARDLRMRLVAEGVENERQAQFLLENQCFVAQGFYFSRPLSRERYLELLRRERMHNTHLNDTEDGARDGKLLVGF